MKKCLLILAVFMTSICENSVSAETVYMTEYAEKNIARYEQYIDRLLEQAGDEAELIDKDSITINAYAVENMRYIMLMLDLPRKDGEDVYFGIAELPQNEVTKLISEKEFERPFASQLNEMLKSSMLEECMQENNLGESEFIMPVYMDTNYIGLLYHIECGKEKYVIPYLIEESSRFFKPEDERFKIDIGKLYGEQEFLDILEKEYTEYREAQKKNNNGVYYDDQYGYMVEKLPGGIIYDEGNEEYVYPDETRVSKFEYEKDNENAQENKKDEAVEPVKKDDDTKAKDKTDEEEKSEVKTAVDDAKKTDDKAADSNDKKSDETKTEPVELTTEQKADALNSAGLLRGTGNGFELDKTLTRAEAAAVLVRLAGNEDTALTGDYNAVFEDVTAEHWAYKYVMYAYEQGTTKGTSETAFTPERAVSAEEFLTLIIRIMGDDSATPETALEKAQNMQLVDKEQAEQIKLYKNFYRRQMVDICYNVYNITK